MYKKELGGLVGTLHYCKRESGYGCLPGGTFDYGKSCPACHVWLPHSAKLSINKMTEAGQVRGIGSR